MKVTNLDRVLCTMAYLMAPGEAHQSAVIVAAWKAYPTCFGLEWFEDDHPDAKGVYLVLLYGLRHGMLRWTRPKHLELTENGRTQAALVKAVLDSRGAR